MRTGKMMGAQRLSRVLWGCAVLSEAVLTGSPTHRSPSDRVWQIAVRKSSSDFVNNSHSRA